MLVGRLDCRTLDRRPSSNSFSQSLNVTEHDYEHTYLVVYSRNVKRDERFGVSSGSHNYFKDIPIICKDG